MAELSKEQKKVILETLGEEYTTTFEEFLAKEAEKKTRRAVKDLATAMISENGKYFDTYSRLEVQLDGIWEKAVAEAKAELGVVDK